MSAEPKTAPSPGTQGSHYEITDCRELAQSDGFAELAEKIRADRTFDPQRLHFNEFGRASLAHNRLQELEDVLNGHLRARRDFDW